MCLDVGVLRQFAAAGFTRSEIAEKIGLSYSRTNTLLREHGIQAKRKKTRQPQRGPRPQTLKIIELRECGLQRKKIAEVLGCSLDTVCAALKKYGKTHPYSEVSEEQAIEIISQAGYDYVSGFFNTHSKVLIRCRQCGGEYERMYAIIRKQLEGKYPNEPECPCCKRKEIERREKEEHERIEREAHEKARLKAERDSRRISNELARRLAIHVCKNCGQAFCIECSGYNSETYCSEKCQKRYVNRIKNEKRMDRLKHREHDTDITLEKLFKRDGGVCYICGELCQWSDIEEIDGTMVAGEHYPSIDHVRPVAKGGTHTWNNIRLACRHCNTLKGKS